MNLNGRLKSNNSSVTPLQLFRIKLAYYSGYCNFFNVPKEMTKCCFDPIANGAKSWMFK